LLDHAEQVETAMHGASEALTGVTGELSGQIRIGAPDGCANYLLPPVLAQMAQDHPGLEVQVVALPRVFNLSKREADMAIGVSRPTAGRLTVQKLTDYRLHLAAERGYLDRMGWPQAPEDLQGHRMVGYIPDMIFDKELDYLTETGAPLAQLASNSVSVQLNMLRAGAGIGVVHDFALPSAPELVKVMTDRVSLRRAFWLIRHESDGRVERLNRFAAALADGVRRELARLEGIS
jgi:DNA-binding transcriptional LysR family regulator